MRKILAVLIVLWAFAVVATSVANAEPGAIRTVGNSSYITVENYGNPHEMQHTILDLRDKFEKSKNLKVLSYNVEKQQRSYITSPYVYGILVTHEPRK